MKILLDTAKIFPLYGRQLCFSFINVKVLIENDEGFLINRLVAPRPSNKHVGLGLT